MPIVLMGIHFFIIVMNILLNQYDNLILFDGVCNFCNASVNFIIDRDVTKRYKFTSLQSDVGQSILEATNKNKHDFDTLYFVENGKLLQKSQAALAIAKGLGSFWALLVVFDILPRFLLDLCYDMIAKNRYRFFGKSDACRMPTQDMKERFL